MDCLCGKLDTEIISGKNVINSKYEMIETEEAMKRIREYFKKLEQESDKKNRVKDISMEEINGNNSYISSEKVYSKVNVPSFKTSMMDGYGINSSLVDFNSVLKVLDKIYAGDIIGDSILGNIKNTCIYVTTGSPLPKDIDFVIPVEYVEQIENGKLIKFNSSIDNFLRSSNFIRNVGSDIHKDELLLDENKSISLHDLGILTSAGINHVSVYKLPKIGIISTGDELVNPYDYNSEIHMNKVVDTNRMLLIKLLREAYPNIEIIDYGIINDNLEKIEEIFANSIKDNCDFLISSGGVSMGEKDYIKIFLEKNGDIIFGRLNMKPGKPTTFGKYKNLTVFGLPGNPVSSIVCYHLIVFPAIKMFQNPNLENIQYENTRIKAKLLHEVDLSDRPEYARGYLYFEQEGDSNYFFVGTTGNQRSSRMNSFKDFNCLVLLPKAGEILKKLSLNMSVDVLLIENQKFQQFKILDKSTKQKIFACSNQNYLENKNMSSNQNIIKYTVTSITISDRAYKGEYTKDNSTEELRNYFSKKPNENSKFSYELIKKIVIPDDKEELLKVLKESVESCSNLIVTSGGTGLTKRDITNEVVKNFIDKEATGISTYILSESIKITKFACLSNPIIGVKGNSLIVTLPGSPKAIKENLSILESIFTPALNQISNIRDFH